MQIPVTALIVIVLIALLFIIVGLYAGQHLKRAYGNDVTEGLKRTMRIEPALIAEADLEHLPDLVRDYLIYVGVVGKPRVHNMKVTFSVEMRSRTQDWFNLPTYGEAVWHYPEGEFAYGKFTLENVQYNVGMSEAKQSNKE